MARLPTVLPYEAPPPPQIVPLDSSQGQHKLALPAVADLDAFDLGAGASAAAAHAARLSSAISACCNASTCACLWSCLAPTWTALPAICSFCLNCSTLNRLFGVCFALQSKVDWLRGRAESLLDSSNAGALMGSEPVPAASWVLERQLMVLTSAKQVLHLPQQNESCTCLGKTGIAPASAQQVLH